MTSDFNWPGNTSSVIKNMLKLRKTKCEIKSSAKMAQVYCMLLYVVSDANAVSDLFNRPI